MPLVFVGACLQANRACQRASPQSNIRRLAGSHKGQVFCLCRSLPASESYRSTGFTSVKHSPAGRLLQGEGRLVFVGRAGPQAPPVAINRRQAGSYKGQVFCLCRSLPASESCRSTGFTSVEHSPAGRLLQGEGRLVFVGLAGPQASPTEETYGRQSLNGTCRAAWTKSWSVDSKVKSCRPHNWMSRASMVPI